jgi:hypothetical protein
MIFLLFTFLLQAHAADSTVPYKVSGPPIEKPKAPEPAEIDAEPPAFLEFKEKWHVYFATDTQSYQFSLSGGKELDFKPNMNTLSVIGVNYAGLGGISLGFREGLDENARDKGSTKYDDLRFNLTYRQLNVFMVYSRYSGFYLDNTKDIANPAQTGPDIYPGMTVQNIGVHLTYVLNPKRFSLAAMMDHTERQIRSGGSWLLGLSAVETGFHNDGPIIPPQARDGYASDGTIYGGQILSMSVRAGGGYTYCFGGKNKKWFVSGLASAGVGPQQLKINTSTQDYTAFKFYLNQYDIRVSFGWNGDDWYAGLSGLSEESFYLAQTAKLTSEVGSGGLFIGTRF